MTNTKFFFNSAVKRHEGNGLLNCAPEATLGLFQCFQIYFVSTTPNKIVEKIKHLYQISDFHPLSKNSMLKLEESPPCEFFGVGSISEFNKIDMGGGGAIYFFLRNQGFLSKIYKNVLFGVV